MHCSNPEIKFFKWTIKPRWRPIIACAPSVAQAIQYVIGTPYYTTLVNSTIWLTLWYQWLKILQIIVFPLFFHKCLHIASMQITKPRYLLKWIRQVEWQFVIFKISHFNFNIIRHFIDSLGHSIITMRNRWNYVSFFWSCHFDWIKIESIWFVI